MGKISTEARKKYFDKIKEYKQIIEEMQKREKNIAGTIRQVMKMEPSIKRVMLADEVLNRTSFYILMNKLSHHAS